MSNQPLQPDWNSIDTVFLDMDGTILDLHFDNHFWREHVPLRYAERHRLDVETAKSDLFPKFRSKEGTMDWYCVEYWSRELDLDIVGLKEEIDHLIAVLVPEENLLGPLVGLRPAIAAAAARRSAFSLFIFATSFFK